MALGRKLWWGDWPAAAFEKLDPEKVIAIVPLAAVEQHGPHLPLCTDTAIMEGMLATLFPRLPGTLDVRFLPIQAVGKSNEHMRFPGTLSLPATALVETWTELGACVARTGIRKIVLLTSHGGNEEVAGIVCRELRVRFNMLAVRSSWNRFGQPAGLYADGEDRKGIHGGDVETSLMLHFRRDLVDMEQASDFPSSIADAERDFAFLRPTGPHGFAWLAGDLSPTGVVGNAAAATAEKGRLTAEHQAEGFSRLLEDIAMLKLADYLS